MLLANLFAVSTVFAPTSTRIYVDPAMNRINPLTNEIYAVGESFSVDIKAADITSTDSLYGWEFYLTFTPSLLQVASVTKGPFLGDFTMWAFEMVKPEIDNDNGLVTAGDMLLDFSPGAGKTGNGTLATIRFSIIGEGVTPLHFTSSDLITVKSAIYVVKIDHKALDGAFDNRPEWKPPHAIFEAPATGVVGLEYKFDASDSNDADDGGYIVSYFWDFGDGTNATGKIVMHAYALERTYTVSLTVTDNNGLTDTATKDVVIKIWMEAGWFPDLVGKQAWPEKHRWNEIPDGRKVNFYARVGNPTQNDYQVYVEFAIMSKDEAKPLGKITTDTVTIHGGEKLDLAAVMDLTELRWRAYSGSPEWIPYGYFGGILRKYWVFAKCYYNDGSGFKEGFVIKDFGFNVYPEKHDIGIVSLSTSPTYIRAGQTLQIYVNITNKGVLSETFTLFVSYTGELASGTIEERTVTLAAGETRVETFTWKIPRKGIAEGPYLIKAVLPQLTYELPKHTGDQSAVTIIYVV